MSSRQPDLASGGASDACAHSLDARAPARRRAAKMMVSAGAAAPAARAATTEAPYDREAINALEAVFGKPFVTEKNETLNRSILLKSGLAGASKSGAGSGVPDAVVFLDPECKSPFILVEAKAPGLMDQAWSDLAHYAGKLLDASIHVPFGLAVSGGAVELRVFDPKTRAHATIEVEDVANQTRHELTLSSVRGLAHHKEILKDLYLRNEPVARINIPGFNQDQVMGFCVDINKTLHAMGIKEDKRATILTYFLVCCLNAKFARTMDSLKDNPDALVSYSRSVFEKIVQNKRFALNKNIFSILEDDIGGAASKSERESREKYMRGYLAIFGVIDQKLAKEFKGLCATRSDFVARLLQSGNFLGDAYEVFHTYSAGNDMGQYFTPRHAVELMIDVIEQLRGFPIGQDDVIYDPACGVGGFLCLALKHAVASAPEHKREGILDRLGGRIYGAEIEPTVADMAKVNMLLRGDGKSGILTGSSLDWDWPGALSPIKERFKKDKKRPSLVLMNPPFPSKHSNFKSYDFITHALDVADEGAFIGAVVPLSVVNGRGGCEQFRKETLRGAQLRAVVALPPELFAPKASVDTAIVILQKSRGGHRDDVGVVFASCANDGLRMHKGKKQRVSDFNAPNEFQLLCNHWLPGGTGEVFEKFIRRNPMTESPQTRAYFVEGGEWSPYQWLNANPLFSEPDELARLAKHVLADYGYAKSIRNLGGKW